LPGRHYPAPPGVFLQLLYYRTSLSGSMRYKPFVRFCQGISQRLSWVFSALSVFSPERSRSRFSYQSAALAAFPLPASRLFGRASSFSTGIAGFQRSDLDFEIRYKPQPTVFPFSYYASPWGCAKLFPISRIAPVSFTTSSSFQRTL
jgi:hypothetical protein